MVIVNWVVNAQAGPGQSQVALAAFGAGAMLAAPHLPDRGPDRPVMRAGLAVLVAGLIAGPILAKAGTPAFLPLWSLLGLGYAAVPKPPRICRNLQPD